MKVDIRSDAAKYYDYNPNPPNDIPFYIARLSSRVANVLELGCGTGRVTIPLSQYCRYVHGIDRSESMISIFREKLALNRIPTSKVTVEVGDITAFELGRKFGLIIAPFRVFQNLETDAEIDGLFDCIKKHLTPQGSCILNVFRPYKDRETLIREWRSDRENLNWEVAIEGGKVALYDRKPRLDGEKLILYPELIYRRYKGDILVDEAILKILMRCYYPAEFEEIITAHGFVIKNQWGGYDGEAYGQGPELVVEFEDSI